MVPLLLPALVSWVVHATPVRLAAVCEAVENCRYLGDRVDEATLNHGDLRVEAFDIHEQQSKSFNGLVD